MTRAEFIERLKKLIEEAENDGRTAESAQNVPNDDLISRKAAIDAIENAFDRETILNRFVRKIAISAVRMLPSAQPEIIRCKDCKHASPNGKYGCKAYHFKQYEVHEMFADDFCSMAERRTDE